MNFCQHLWLKSAIFLNDIGIKVFKISSGDLDNFHLLSKVKKFGKPIIISTGMAGHKLIEKTINFLKLPKSKLAILHCISDYPTHLKNTYLSNIKYLKNFGYNVGFSDHTIGNISSSIAIALGATIINITISRKMNGPDHHCSMPIKELKNFVTILKDVKTSISSTRELTKLEHKTSKIVRKSLHYSKNLKKGSKIKFQDLIPLRPADNNISPNQYKKFIGKKLERNKNKFSALSEKDFKWKIAIFSAARSDFGILKNIILKLEKDKRFDLNLIINSAHLSSKFGNTINEINEINVKKKVYLKFKYNNSNPENIIKYQNNISQEISSYIKKKNPSAFILMGDRYEMLACALSCLQHRVPIIHLCGGSVTLGSLIISIGTQYQEWQIYLSRAYFIKID